MEAGEQFCLNGFYVEYVGKPEGVTWHYVRLIRSGQLIQAEIINH